MYNIEMRVDRHAYKDSRLEGNSWHLCMKQASHPHSGEPRLARNRHNREPVVIGNVFREGWWYDYHTNL